MTAATTTAAPAATTASRVLVSVPDAGDGARKSWCKLVRGVDRGQPGGFAVQGEMLTLGRSYEITAGALLVLVDSFAEHWHVRVLRAETGGLTSIKEWQQKARIGPRITDWIGRRLPAGNMVARAAEHEPWQRNKWAGRCRDCGQTVEARAGWFRREHERRVLRHDDICPPRPPRLNRWAGHCADCDGWIAACEGVLQRRPLLPGEDTVGWRWRICHPGGECPPIPAPRPDRRNLYTDWCCVCGELVEQDQGIWRPDEGTRHREGECAPRPTSALPTWRIRRTGAAFTAGEVLRVQFTPRPDRGEQPLPPAAPGYRRLDEHGFTEAIVVVLEAHGAHRRHFARVRVADPEEAAEILVDDIAQAAQVRPRHGFMASWSREKIGPIPIHRARHLAFKDQGACIPWLAEITGFDPAYGLRREFQPAKWDYSYARKSGIRGIWLHWILRPNTVYEAAWKVTHGRGYREYLRATPEGDVVFIDREEVEAWLRHGAVWPAS